ncbi:MAG: chemotaxis protein CheW [Thermodesulfovibrionales bacterium]
MDEKLKTEDFSGEDIASPSYCFFKRGEKNYYISVECLREVVEFNEIFPVPLAPDYVKGAIPLRGVVIPVIDMLKIENRPGSSTEESGTIIIFEVEKERIGFLADGLPGFSQNIEDLPESSFIDINKFFETYMIKETSDVV